MQVILPDPLDAIARDISEEALARYGSLLDRVAQARESALARDDIQPITDLNIGLIQYLGAAYYLRDRERFDAAAAVIINLAAWLAIRFLPEPRHLLAGLCLAMIRSPSQVRRTITRAVLSTPHEVDILDESGLQARVLASLSDLDPRLAAHETARLRNACIDRVYARMRTRNLLGFVHGAQRIREGTATRFPGWLRLMDRTEQAIVVRELSRASRGDATAITATSFLDLPAAALAWSARARLSRSHRDSFPHTRYSDVRWIGDIAWA